jgi:hypothetical protein
MATSKSRILVPRLHSLCKVNPGALKLSRSATRSFGLGLNFTSACALPILTKRFAASLVLAPGVWRPSGILAVSENRPDRKSSARAFLGILRPGPETSHQDAILQDAQGVCSVQRYIAQLRTFGRQAPMFHVKHNTWTGKLRCGLQVFQACDANSNGSERYAQRCAIALAHLRENLKIMDWLRRFGHALAQCRLARIRPGHDRL